MTKRRRILLSLAAGVPVALVLALGVFVATFDGSGYRETVERLVTDATGRECSIDGEFEIALSLNPRLRVGGITLANAAWSASPAMVSVASARVELDAWSLVARPLRIRDISVEGVQLLLEVDPERGPNWVFDVPTAAPASADEPPAGGGLLAEGLVLDGVRLLDVTLAYHDGEIARTLSIDSLTASTDRAGHLTAQLDGALDTSPLRFGARVGPLVQLFVAGGVEVEANGSLGDTTLTLKGSVADLSSAAEPALTLELQGPQLEQLAEDLRLPVLASGPFRVNARATPNADGIAVAIQADFDRFDADVTGSVDQLAPPSRAAARIDVTGPDLARLGVWLGIEELPGEAFTVNGDLGYADGTTTVEALRVAVGAARLAVDGTLGAPPQMTGTDVRFELSGPDLAPWAAIANLEVPAGAYGAAGHVTRSDDELVLDDVTASVGDNRVSVDGTLATVPGLAGTDLTIEGSGPSVAELADLADIALPDEPFELSGRVRREQTATRLDGVHVRLGEIDLRADGTFGDPPALAGTELDVKAEGPELARIGDIIGVPLFGGAFAADGRITLAADGLGLHEIDARLEGNTARVADGYIGWGGDDVTLRFDAHAIGPDLADLLAEILETYAGGPLPFPARPFDVNGIFEMDDSGYRADRIRATVGDVAFELTGGIGREPEMDPLDATLSARAESLALLAEYVDLPELPDGRVEIAGRVTSADGVYTLHGVRGRLGENRFTADGGLGRLVDAPNGIDATFDVEGPDLSAFAALSPGFELPAREYGTAGHVRVDGGGFHLTEVTVELGEARAKLHGDVGPLPELIGTDLAIDGDSVLLAWFEAAAGRELPAGRVWIRGRLGRDDTGFQLEHFEAGLGEHRVSAHGLLGEPPRFEGTALSIEAKGPDLVPWAVLADRDDLPDEPYDLTARFDGTPEAFTLRDLAVHLGESDLSGRLTLDLGDTPSLSGDLESHSLDLSAFFGESEVADDVMGTDAAAGLKQPPDGKGPAKKHGDAKTDKAAGAAEPRSGKRRRVFSEEPFDFSALARVDADVRFRGDKLVLNDRKLRAIDISVKVRDGALIIDPVSGTGDKGGRILGMLSVEPAASGYHVLARLHGEELRLGVLGHNPVDEMLQPAARVDLAIEGSGASAHELMSSLDGHLWVVQGPGQIDNNALGLLSADLLFEIFSVLNPFAKDDPYTEVECGVYVLEVEDGLTAIEAIALRTNKLTMGGRGRIDFETEKLDVSWTSKPRKGVGLSASAITNSYIKLGGSLGNPSIEIKPLEAMVTTGAAVMTMGISLLARGMWDRATSGKKVCKKGMKEIEKMIAEGAEIFEDPNREASSE